MNPRAAIFGLKGPTLSTAEKAFFRDADPWAFILFARNVETPDQLTRLTASLRDAVGRDALIFIDQEGGRVQRMRPPHWPAYPPADVFLRQSPSVKDAADMAYLNARLIAADLREVGITANCAPLLDLPLRDADPIIGDRAFTSDPLGAIEMAHAVMAGHMSGGVAPVIKHIPGHGRAMVDSHKSLPLIEASISELETTDFVPFKAFPDAPMAMTAHITLADIDPGQPITLSKIGMRKIVRENLGFDGLVMTDDLDMKALDGDLKVLAAKAIKAGCDIALHCDGNMPKMVRVATGTPRLSGRSLERAIIAQNCAAQPDNFDRTRALARLSSFIGKAA